MGNVCLCFKSSKNGHPYRVNVMLNKPVYVRECSIFTLWRNSCAVVLGARFEPVATGAIHDAHTKGNFSPCVFYTSYFPVYVFKVS